MPRSTPSARKRRPSNPRKARAVSATQARDEFSEIINEVAYGNVTVLVHRRGKPVAAVIPVDDPAFLEEIEDMIDARLVKKAHEDNEPTIPWEEVKRRLRL